MRREGESAKKKVSVAVIGFQREDHRMYPHLYDFLQELRARYDEVIYLPDDDRGEGLFIIEHYLRLAASAVRGIFKRGAKGAALVDGGGNPRRLDAGYLVYLLKKFLGYGRKQLSLAGRIKRLKFRNQARVVLAIDHTAAWLAGKYLDHPVMVWSYDILTTDAPWRLKGGLLEQLITSPSALKPDVLMIQDEPRRELFEQAVGKSYRDVLYLPVSLADSDFCRADSARRRSLQRLERVTVIQSGWLARNRHSDSLVQSFQRWPECYQLHLHGPLHGEDVQRAIEAGERKPGLSSELLDHDSLTRFLARFDIGFVGYGETDLNHFYIENASAQLVGFLRLGMPVIAHLPSRLNEFVDEHGIGAGVADLADMQGAIAAIAADYGRYAANSRELFEKRFHLRSLLDTDIFPGLERVAGYHEGAKE